MIVTLMKRGKDGRILYYTIHDRQQSLTSSHALTTLFRSGAGRERERHYEFDSLSRMDAMIKTLLVRRIKGGYRLLYSWSRDAKWAGAPDSESFQAGLLSRAAAARDSPPRSASG